jgi:predicted RNA-binding protein associated with RNAse of E/G family
MVDLDLDVIRTFTGETRLLDEDEFELHRVELEFHLR